MIAEPFRALVSSWTFAIALLVYGFAPGMLLRVIVLAFRHDDPRRRELLAELHAVRRIERPFWVIEQLEVALFEGIVGRLLLAARRPLADAPGISAGHRARLLVHRARTQYNLGRVGTADRVAAQALAEATKTGDNWAMGWALHVLAIAAVSQGRIPDALPLFDRALTVTQADPDLADLQLLLQINKAVALGDLDQYERAFDAAFQVRQLANCAGIVVRKVQAHSALGQLLFHTGQWDDALAEVKVLPDHLKGPSVACCDHGVAAVISFHRGEYRVARHHLTAAAPHIERIGNRVLAPLALARSLDAEHRGDFTKALATLTAGFASNAEELEEMEHLLPDAVRLAMKVGDFRAARTLAGRADTLASEMEIPHRQAHALHCRGLLDYDAARLFQASEHYEEARRPLFRANALEAAASFLIANGDVSAARATAIRALDVYASLNATSDTARLHTLFHIYAA